MPSRPAFISFQCKINKEIGAQNSVLTGSTVLDIMVNYEYHYFDCILKDASIRKTQGETCGWATSSKAMLKKHESSH